MRIAILGPGGVGGFLAGALARAGAEPLIVAREPTAALIEREGIRVRSVLLGDFDARPQAVARLEQPVDALIVATKASGLATALERIASAPALVVPLLNGLDHMQPLRQRFGDTVAAGAIRIEADRPQPGVVVQTSPFLRVDMATADPALRPAVDALAAELVGAGVPARVAGSEPQIMWEKLVRLNALACVTSAYDVKMGAIRADPAMSSDLDAAVREAVAVANAEGAAIDAEEPLAELAATHDTLGSSMQRDIAAGREPELDAIPGAVLRAAARHGLACPTIERLAGEIARRAGVAAPLRLG